MRCHRWRFCSRRPATPAASLATPSRKSAMPTLLELQNAIQRSLVHRENHTVSAMLAVHVSQDRLDIYRNTFLQSLTKVLRLCFPVVQRLVGEEFFEGTVQVFIAEHPPKAAWLEQYGGEFPGFLRTFPPATSIAY